MGRSNISPQDATIFFRSHKKYTRLLISLSSHTIHHKPLLQAKALRGVNRNRRCAELGIENDGSQEEVHRSTY